MTLLMEAVKSFTGRQDFQGFLYGIMIFYLFRFLTAIVNYILLQLGQTSRKGKKALFCKITQYRQ